MDSQSKPLGVVFSTSYYTHTQTILLSKSGAVIAYNELSMSAAATILSRNVSPYLPAFLNTQLLSTLLTSACTAASLSS